MKYVGMYKLFYTQSDKYEDIYKSKMNSDSVYKYDFYIGKNQAFVISCTDTVSLISEIHRLDKKLEKICRNGNIPGVAIQQFINSCIIDEVILTNEIEGVHSTRKEITSIMESKIKQKKEDRLRGLVEKYVLLLTSEEPIELNTPEQVRHLYDEIALPEIKENDGDIPDGKLFRKGGVDVLSKTGKVIHNGLVPEKKIIKNLEDGLKILNSEEFEPLINIAVFHYIFGYIHPFYDGNGRMTRFISSSYLARFLGKIVGLGLSFTIKENLTKYYDIFRVTNHVNNKGDLTVFVIEFLKFLKETLKRVIEGLEERRNKLDFYSEKIEKCGLKTDKLKALFFILLQASLFAEEDGVNIQDLSEYTRSSVSHTRTLLDQIPAQFVIKEKRGKTNYYMANLESLDAL